MRRAERPFGRIEVGSLMFLPCPVPLVVLTLAQGERAYEAPCSLSLSPSLPPFLLSLDGTFGPSTS